MTLLEKFNNYYQEKPINQAEKILFGVLNDLFDRGGFDNAWSETDDDIKEELLSENLEIVKNNLP